MLEKLIPRLGVGNPRAMVFEPRLLGQNQRAVLNGKKRIQLVPKRAP
jgi:hypothetical protein